MLAMAKKRNGVQRLLCRLCRIFALAKNPCSLSGPLQLAVRAEVTVNPHLLIGGLGNDFLHVTRSEKL